MRVLIAGDYCPRERVANAFEKGDFKAAFGAVKPLIESADYSLVNLECSVTSGLEKPIVKLGDTLRCSEKGIEAIKWAGFKCLTLANNHFYDYGEDGVSNTLKICKKHELDIVGGGMNLESASSTLYKRIGDSSLAIINCCEHEFSIATDSSAGSNPLNPIRQFRAIQQAKKDADYVIVVVHGGHEHFQLPSPRMVDTYRFFIDAGADAVVNHHQHCFSGYEVYKDKPIFYGLGNLCFDGKKGRGRKWNFGYLIVIDFQNDGIDYELYPYNQCDKEPTVTILPRDSFNDELDRLNTIILNRDMLIRSVDEYYSRRSIGYSNIFEPFSNRIFKYLRCHNILPSLTTNRRILSANNYILCESHRDLLAWWLRNRVKRMQ